MSLSCPKNVGSKGSIELPTFQNLRFKVNRILGKNSLTKTIKYRVIQSEFPNSYSRKNKQNSFKVHKDRTKKNCF